MITVSGAVVASQGARFARSGDADHDRLSVRQAVEQRSSPPRASMLSRTGSSPQHPVNR